MNYVPVGLKLRLDGSHKSSKYTSNDYMGSNRGNCNGRYIATKTEPFISVACERRVCLHYSIPSEDLKNLSPHDVTRQRRQRRAFFLPQGKFMLKSCIISHRAYSTISLGRCFSGPKMFGLQENGQEGGGVLGGIPSAQLNCLDDNICIFHHFNPNSNMQRSLLYILLKPSNVRVFESKQLSVDVFCR